MASTRIPCLGWYRLYRNWSHLFSTREDLRFNDVVGAYDLPAFTALVEEDVLTPAKKGDEKNTDEINEQSEETQMTCAFKLAIIGQMKRDEFNDLNAQPRQRVTIMKGEQHLDRPIYVFEWICEDVNELIELTGIPAPILSRVYQELSNGMLGFSQSIKMADIPFPFPFSQLMSVIMRMFTLVAPVGVAHFTQGSFLTPLLTFGITLVYWSLMGIAQELENPYAHGANQLPVIDLHDRFVEGLLVLLKMKGHRYKRRTVASDAVENLRAHSKL
mmetsp:Transcript_97005/g.172660  ORF Transcript_97005/g.172660 Transcript_97005/m.172660 type:complete len:273 (+) Transcript_97005:2-820(+)